MPLYYSLFKLGQKVVVREEFKYGFYSGIVGTIIGLLTAGEKEQGEDRYRVEFFLTRSQKSIVKIIEGKNLMGAGNEPYKT